MSAAFARSAARSITAWVWRIGAAIPDQRWAAITDSSMHEPRTPLGARDDATTADSGRAGLDRAPVEQRSGHDQRAPARDDHAVAGELIEGPRDRLAAGADHVGQLLLGGAAADHDPFRRLGPLLARQRDQPVYQTLVDVAQRQL